jgi:hypothetical protein
VAQGVASQVEMAEIAGQDEGSRGSNIFALRKKCVIKTVDPTNGVEYLSQNSITKSIYKTLIKI